MASTEIMIVTAEFVSEESVISIQEVCQACGVHAELIIEMVEYGLIEPIDIATPEWHFQQNLLPKIKSAIRLQQDLDINWAGLAVILDLLDEVEELRQRVRFLEQRSR